MTVKSAQLKLAPDARRDPVWSTGKSARIGGPYATFYANTNNAVRLGEYVIRRPGGKLSDAVVNLPGNPQLTWSDAQTIARHLVANHKGELGSLTEKDIADGIAGHVFAERLPFAKSHLGTYDINKDPYERLLGRVAAASRTIGSYADRVRRHPVAQSLSRQVPWMLGGAAGGTLLALVLANRRRRRKYVVKRADVLPGVMPSLVGALAAGTGGYLLTPRRRGWRKRLSNALSASSVGGLVGALAGQYWPRTTPPKGPKAATRGEDIADSVARGLEIYSVVNGGGGTERFPARIRDVAKNLPPCVRKATEGCFTTPAVPLHGYTASYVRAPSSNDFEVVVRPAAGYTGDVFRVSRDLKIRRSPQ